MLLLSVAVIGGAFVVKAERLRSTMVVLGAVMLGAWASTLARHATGYDMQIHHWNHRVFSRCCKSRSSWRQATESGVWWTGTGCGIAGALSRRPSPA